MACQCSRSQRSLAVSHQSFSVYWTWREDLLLRWFNFPQNEYLGEHVIKILLNCSTLTCSFVENSQDFLWKVWKLNTTHLVRSHISAFGFIQPDFTLQYNPEWQYFVSKFQFNSSVETVSESTHTQSLLPSFAKGEKKPLIFLHFSDLYEPLATSPLITFVGHRAARNDSWRSCRYSKATCRQNMFSFGRCPCRFVHRKRSRARLWHTIRARIRKPWEQT